jgi:PIN domain nuclease of toxin-antitoxin system
LRLLLDTHVVLWAASAPDELEPAAREAIEDTDNDGYVSPVTAWEIAIKQSLGKLALAAPAERWLPKVIDRSGFSVAPLTLDAALRVRALPWHHRDPFDRLLIAQAIDAGYTVVTRDKEFAEYGVAVIVA